ncbi:hypothetical protein [Natronospira bacteriovora]|uniref:Uncharacterized protein n=1 Tax=Natronospira bacteriovora TaxID=3069753 RepID=A0ABU0W860_9GAMM|nr:hypothetical protein [Natronospira sp. AB-CW4]MDQ2069195.1 hypothetical protein [Natronospira sp. AB-CW4]
MSETQVKRYLRAAYKADPDTFSRLVREYLEHGEEVFDAPKPGTNAGRKKQIGLDNYALLYVRVSNLRARGLSETAALKEIAERKDYWANHESGFSTTIESASTARKHFKHAEKMYNDDPLFREWVEFLVWAYKAIT